MGMGHRGAAQPAAGSSRKWGLGQKGRWGEGRVSLQLQGGMLTEEGMLANVSSIFFCPHRVQGTMALLHGVTATQR